MPPISADEPTPTFAEWALLFSQSAVPPPEWGPHEIARMMAQASISTAKAIGMELGKCSLAPVDTDTIIKRALAEPIGEVAPLHYCVVFAALTLDAFATSEKSSAIRRAR